MPALPPLVAVTALRADTWLGALSARTGRSQSRVQKLAVALALALLLPCVWRATRIVASPRSANLVRVDRWQYLEGWPSGFAFSEAALHLDDLLSGEPTASVVALHIGDFVRLRAYDPTGRITERLHQIQVADGSSLPPEEQRRRLDLIAAASSFTYLVLSDSGAWSRQWQPQLPRAIREAAFPRAENRGRDLEIFVLRP